MEQCGFAERVVSRREQMIVVSAIGPELLLQPAEIFLWDHSIVEGHHFGLTL
jgi:hypothetical protein